MYDETPAPKPKADGKTMLLSSTVASMLLHASVAAWASQLAVQPQTLASLEVEIIQADALEPPPAAPTEAASTPDMEPSPVTVASKPDPQKSNSALTGTATTGATDTASTDTALGPDEYLVETPTPPPPEVARNVDHVLPDQSLPRNAEAEVLAAENSFGRGGENPRPDGTDTETRGYRERGIGQVLFLDAERGRGKTEPESLTSPAGQADDKELEAPKSGTGFRLGGNQLDPKQEEPGPLAPISATGVKTARLSPSPLSGPVDSIRAPGPLQPLPPSASSPSTTQQADSLVKQSRNPSEALSVDAPGLKPSPTHAERSAQPEPPPPAPEVKAPPPPAPEVKAPPPPAPEVKAPPPPAAPRDEKPLPDKTPLTADTGQGETLRPGKPDGVATQTPKPRPIAPRPEAEGSKAPGFLDGNQDRNRNARPGQSESAPLPAPTVAADAPKAKDGTLIASVPHSVPVGPEQSASPAQAGAKRGSETVPPQKLEKPAPRPKSEQGESPPTTVPPPAAVPPPTTVTPPAAVPAGPVSEKRLTLPVLPVTPQAPGKADPSAPPQPAVGGAVQGVGTLDGDKGRELVKKEPRIGIKQGADAPGLAPNLSGDSGEDARGGGDRSLEPQGRSELWTGGSVASKPRELRIDQASLLDAQQTRYWALNQELQHRIDIEFNHPQYSINQLRQEGVVVFCVQVRADGRVLEHDVWPVDGMDREVLIASGRSLLGAALKKPLKKFPEDWALDMLIVKVELVFSGQKKSAGKKGGVKCTQRDASATLPSETSKPPVRPQPLRPPSPFGTIKP